MSWNSKPKNELEKVEASWTQVNSLLTKIRENAAVFYLNKGTEIIIEFVCYLLAIAMFILIFIMNSIFPFHVLGEVLNNSVIRSQVSNAHDLHTFNLAVKMMVALVGILFLIIGFSRRKIRLKNSLIHEASAVVKEYEKELKERLDSHQKEMNQTANLLNKVEPKPFSSL